MPSSLVAQVCAVYCETVVDVQHVGQGHAADVYTIGQGHGVSLAAPIAYESFPLVSRDDRGFVLCLGPGMHATRWADGRSEALEASTTVLTPGSRVAVCCASLRFEIQLVDAATLTVSGNALEWPVLAAIGSVAAVASTFLALFSAMPEAREIHDLETGPRQARFARYMAEPAPVRPPTRAIERTEPRTSSETYAPARPKQRSARRGAPSPAMPDSALAPATPQDSRSRPRALRRPAAWRSSDGEQTYAEQVVGGDVDPIGDDRGAGVLGSLTDNPPETLLAAGTFDMGGADVDKAFAAWAQSDLGSKGLGGLDVDGPTVGGGTADALIGAPSSETSSGGRDSHVAVSRIRLDADRDGDESALRRVIVDRGGAVAHCFDGGARTPRMPRFATITITLSPDGGLEATTSARGGPKPSARCVEKAARTWDLPRSQGVKIRYRITP